MRLPEDWNGRYFHQMNGGNDGAIVPAYGNLQGNQPDNALARGYAVLSSDSGHDGQANSDAGLISGNLFGFDHQARLDYGYTANVTLTPIAKRIIEGYYGERPQYSYMVGCSNGGRHALVGATRLAHEFDGFLAGAPGYNLPMVGLQHAWDVQSFERVTGDIRSAFSREDVRLVADAVLEQCDALDGAADGIVGALEQCQRTFDIERLSCRVRRGDSCLDEKQIGALSRPRPSIRSPRWTSWHPPTGASRGSRNCKPQGGKVIVYHGASDGAFSIDSTVDWYEKITANNGGDVRGFARFYPVPGMAHCGGGPATDRFDLFSALVDWVEQNGHPRT